MNESLTITCLPDGTYHVLEKEDPSEAGQGGDPPISQIAKSADEVKQLVEQFLDQENDESEGPGDDAGQPPEAGDAGAGADPSMAAQPAAPTKAAWMQEAATRQPNGLRK